MLMCSYRTSEVTVIRSFHIDNNQTFTCTVLTNKIRSLNATPKNIFYNEQLSVSTTWYSLLILTEMTNKKKIVCLFVLFTCFEVRFNLISLGLTLCTTESPIFSSWTWKPCSQCNPICLVLLTDILNSWGSFPQHLCVRYSYLQLDQMERMSNRSSITPFVWEDSLLLALLFQWTIMAQ